MKICGFIWNFLIIPEILNKSLNLLKTTFSY